MSGRWMGAGVLALALLASVSAGHAQETAPAAEQWRGFHVGGEIGAAWSSYSWGLNPNYFNTQGPLVLGNELDAGKGGFAGGAVGGSSWSFGPVVLGAELSVRGGDLAQTQPDPWFPASDISRSEIFWMASAVGRAGYAWQRWQLFGKAGYAGADAGFTLIDTNTGITSTLERWINGWTVGVGAEYMVVDRISIGVTWDYTDLAASGVGANCRGCGSGVGLGSPVVDPHLRLNAIMARLTFHPGP